jgi:hypothetical protein
MCLYVLPIVSRQWFYKDVPEASSSKATIEVILDAVFSVPSVSYQIFICFEGKVGD